MIDAAAPVASAPDAVATLASADDGPREVLSADLTTYGAARTAATAATRVVAEGLDPAAGVADLRDGDHIAGRYALARRIGEGAQGEVWTAHDLLLGERVALKWLGPQTAASARARREIAVLRMLRLPGVARLLDEGTQGDRAFVVMELVPGAPFPGAPSGALPCAWGALERVTLALLETLGRVHAAGVVHRDLKPANVLVRPDGQPVVLDFGISQRSTDGAADAAGTPAYMAPEQLFGGTVDGRADLHAVGAMLFEALSGLLPGGAAKKVASHGGVARAARVPLSSVAPQVPAHVAAILDAMLAVRAEDRPRSAADVIAALRGAEAASRRRSPSRGPISEKALRGWFAGPDRLFHLREDGARALREATAGDPARIEAELDAWERLGLARRDGDDIVVDRAALAHLSALRVASRSAGLPSPGADDRGRAAAHVALAAALDAGEEGRLFHLLSAGDSAAAAVEAVETARARARRGDLAGATAALELGLSARRASSAPSALERALLSELVKVALVEATPAAHDRALYELSRAFDRSDHVVALDALVRAALAAPGPSGLTKAAEVPPFADPSLERRRHRVRITAAAARTSPELIERALDDVRLWAARSPHPFAALALAEGTALLRYAEGRYAEAARLHLEASRLEPWVTGQLAALSNAASSHLEAFAHREAARHARVARRLASRHRVTYLEARAEWLLRAARYRAAEPLAPDMELVELVERVGVPTLSALVGFTEAAIAFRARRFDAAFDLASRAARTWRQLDRAAGTLLANALAIAAAAASGRAPDGDLEALLAQALACPVPGVGLQALGLLAIAAPALRDRIHGPLERRVATVAPEHRRSRMDVLSADEARTGHLESLLERS